MTLTKRVIPCLDVANGRVVIGLHFKSINLLKIRLKKLICIHMKIMIQVHGFFLRIPAVLQRNAP